jgi:hypothetical protein
MCGRKTATKQSILKSGGVRASGSMQHVLQLLLLRLLRLLRLLLLTNLDTFGTN